MQLPILIFGVILTANHALGTQQIQMPESASFMTDDDLNDQLDRIKHNITELWTNFNELKTVLTQTLNHLRVHQSELEETVHMLEHKHDSTGGTAGSYTDDHHHHHSGEQHSDDSHSHGSDDHHHHSGEQHSHGSDHSHSGESHSSDSHSHGDDSHSHGDDSHSHGGSDDHHHSGEQHSHGSDHYHSSYSHSHSHSGHDMDGDNHQHGDSHEKSDNLQQTQQGADSMLEPLIQPTNVQQHYHQQKPPMGTPSSSLQLISDNRFNNHHHHHQRSRGRSQRNRTVDIPKFSEFPLYDFAVCNVQPNRAIPEDQQQEIMGRINLWQKKTGGPLNFHVRLQGFDMGDHHHHDAQQSIQKEEDNETPVAVVHKHGFHIHSLGDLSNGCQSTGAHYNPKNVNHGGPNALIRHVGDLGNIQCDDHGNANIVFNDDIASMKGPYSVIGKSIVIHANQDDYGLGGDEESLRTGNAGTRLACCVIEKVDKLPIRSFKYIKVATLHQN